MLCPAFEVLDFAAGSLFIFISFFYCLGGGVMADADSYFLLIYLYIYLVAEVMDLRY